MNEHDRVQIVEVLEANDGQRIDNFLLRHLRGVPRSRIYRLIRRGEVRLNKKRCKPDRKLVTGDLVRIPPVNLDAKPKAQVKVSPGLQQLLQQSVLLEEERFLVINKPPGLAVHGGSGIRLGLLDALHQLKPEWRGLELAHRLDRDTSGCLLLSKKTQFLRYVQQEFKDKTVDKQYLALVHGSWPEDLIEVAAPLLKNELSGGERIVRVAAEGKQARTLFQVEKRFSAATLLRVRPETGRTHQIRVHCHYGGHPIVGDPKYAPMKDAATLPGVKFLCLHAVALGFRPGAGETPVTVSAPLPQSFQALLDSLE